MKRQILALLVGYLAIIGILCSCSNSKKYSMFMSNKQHQNFYKSESISTKPSILWKVKTGAEVVSSPILYDETIYIGSNDKKLYAIDANTGKTKWTFTTNGEIASTPAAKYDLIMFLSYDGFFYAVDSDGKLVWKFETEGEKKYIITDYFDTTNLIEDMWDFYLSSPVIKDDLVYFGSSDSNVYALNIKTGKKVWNYKTNGSIHSSPAIYENALFIGNWASNIYSLNATNGKLNWAFTTGQDKDHYIFKGIQASPSIENGIVYIGSRDASLYALNATSSVILWKQNNFENSWFPSSVAIGENNIYTGSSGAMSFYSVKKDSGSINYKAKTNYYTFSTPAIDENMGYIGSTNGRLYGIDLLSGKTKWEFQTLASRADKSGKFTKDGLATIDTTNYTSMVEFSLQMTKAFKNCGAIVSSPIINNQVIYFGSYDGYIYAITDKTK